MLENSSPLKEITKRVYEKKSLHNPQGSSRYLQRKLFWTLSGDTTRAKGMRQLLVNAVRSEIGVSLFLLVLFVLVVLLFLVIIVVVVGASRRAHVLRQDWSNNLLTLSLLFGVLLGVRFGILADEVYRIRECVVHFLDVFFAHFLMDVLVLIDLSIDHAANTLYIRFQRGL